MIRDKSLTSAKKLSQALLEGEEAILTAMKLLETFGFLERGYNRIGGKIIAFTRVTEAGLEFYMSGLPQRGFRGAVSPASLQPSELYSYYQDNTNTQLLLVKSPGKNPGKNKKPFKEILMPYDIFSSTSSSDDDEIEARRRWQKKQKDDWRDAKAARRRLPKEQVPRDAWSCAEVVDYFVDLMGSTWAISSFTVTKDRFIPGLSGKRKQFDTNGEIECRMIDLLFESLQHDKFKNGDMLWKNFLTRYAEFDQLARASITNPEQEMVAQTTADKSWDWMDND